MRRSTIPLGRPLARGLRCAAIVVALAIGMHASARAAAAGEYRLSVGDVVSFDFLDDALPPEQLTVAASGRINIPLIGGFDVLGLTVPEAVAAMRQTFIDRRFFVDPQIALSVASVRPIFVLGDVKAPGSFPFQPLLTVEQAVALAGGQATGLAAAEDRVVTRARLRGTLEVTDVEIAREAVAAARVTAQLKNRAEVLPTDMPLKAREHVSAELVESLLATERQILGAERRAFASRRDQLTAAVAEVTGALANLEQLAQKQRDVIASSKSELERAKGLNKRGLKTLTELSNVERDSTAQEAHLLQIFNEMSTTRRELGDLQRQLADLTDSRERLGLMALQGHIAEIERLIASRRSTEEQILLVGALAAKEARQSKMIVFTYEVRRKIDGRTVTHSATLDDAVLPGDTVLVALAPPGSDGGISPADAAFLEAPQ